MKALFQKFAANHIVQRLWTAIPLTFAICLVLAWHGQPAMVALLLAGIVIYKITDWALLSKAERRERIQWMAVFVRENRIFLKKAALYILLTAFMFTLTTEPKEPSVQKVFSIVREVGYLSVFFIAGIEILLRGFSPVNNVFTLLRGIVFFTGALLLIGTQGDSLYRWELTRQEDVEIFAAAIFIVWTGLSLSITPYLQAESRGPGSGAESASANVKTMHAAGEGGK